MPRGTRKRSTKSKQPLQFVHPPLDGAFHPCRPEVRCARNPKIFLSDEQRQSSTAQSWITPQFDASMMSMALRPLRRRGLKKSGSNRSSLNSTLLLSLPRQRRASVCRFPALSFEKAAPGPAPLRRAAAAARDSERAGPGGVLLSDGCPAQPAEKEPSLNREAAMRQAVPSLREAGAQDAGAFKSTPPPAVSHTEREREGLGCTINTPVGGGRPSFKDSGFTPPDVETPDILQRSRTCSAAQETSLSRLRLLFPQTPLQATPPPMLVSDTPEEHYGKKWRRSHLSFL